MSISVHATFSQVCKLLPHHAVLLLNEIKSHPSWKKEFSDNELKWKFEWDVGYQQMSFDDFQNGKSGSNPYPHSMKLYARRSRLFRAVSVPNECIPGFFKKNPKCTQELLNLSV